MQPVAPNFAGDGQNHSEPGGSNGRKRSLSPGSPFKTNMPTEPFIKVSRRALPVELPVTILDAYGELAADFGISRNAVFNLGSRISLPVLRAMKKTMASAVRAAAQAVLDEGKPMQDRKRVRRAKRRK